MKRNPIPLLICLVWFIAQLNLFAVEKKGKDVIVTRINGTEANGELIAVRSDSLLLLEKNSQKDLLIRVADVNTVKLIRKANPLKGASLGLVSAAVIGGIYGTLFPGDVEKDEYYVTLGAAYAAPIGLILGLVTSGIVAYDSTYLFKGRPPYFKDDLLRKLRKHARIKDAN